MLAQIGKAIQRFFTGWYRFVTTRKSNLGTAAAVLGSLLVVCCVGLLFVGLVSPRSTTGTATGVALVPSADTTQPAASIAPVATVVDPTTPPAATTQSTAMPQPTAVPPTAAPTDVPAPTKPSGPSPEVQQYMLVVGQKTQQIGGALQQMGTLLQDPQLSSDEWRIKLAAQLVTIQLAHTDLTKLDPPPEMREIHAAVLDATQDCSDATKLVTSGIDNVRTEDFQKANVLLRSCTTKIQGAAGMMTAYRDQFK